MLKLIKDNSEDFYGNNYKTIIKNNDSEIVLDNYRPKVNFEELFSLIKDPKLTKSNNYHLLIEESGTFTTDIVLNKKQCISLKNIVLDLMNSIVFSKYPTINSRFKEPSVFKDSNSIIIDDFTIELNNKKLLSISLGDQKIDDFDIDWLKNLFSALNLVK